ncbi:MAG: hypothetical protein Q8L48_04620 [Archangium sp.]|nr:hypothetical protein [Archangium sp.]
MSMVLGLTLGFALAQPVAVLFGKELSRKDLVPAAELEAQRRLLPPEQVAAWLEGARCEALQGRVWDAVFADYVKAKALEPTKQEIETCARAHRAWLVKTWPPESGPVPPLDRARAAELLGGWKRDVALYREYGGRLIFQQHGLEPLDAWRKLLEAHEAQGSFVVKDPGLKGCVYRYFGLKFFDAGAEATKKFLDRSPCNGWSE